MTQVDPGARRWDGVTVVAFVAAISLPAIGFLRPVTQVPGLIENRQLTLWPELSRIPFGEWPRKLDAFFQDQVGGRGALIRLHHRTKLALGVSPTPDVILGKDGWLFFDRDGVFDDLRGVHRGPESSGAKWPDFLEMRHRWLAARGIDYLFVPAPNKEGIYPELLPPAIGSLAPRRRLDRIFEALDARGVPCLDLRPVLSAARGEGLLYHPDDTHWNDRGKLHALRAILEQLVARMPGLEIPGPGEWVTEEREGVGDLSRMIARSEPVRSPRVEPAKGWQARSSPFALDPRRSWPEWGDAWRHPIAYECPGRPGRVLILRDSYFMDPMEKMLADRFGRTVFVSMNPNEAAFESLVDTVQPTLVIEEHGERFFVYEPPYPDP